MSICSNEHESYREALIGVRTLGLNLGYGVRREPSGNFDDSQRVQAKRPVPLDQWLIDHGSLVTTVLAGYDKIQSGTARQIMCGTSSGKTTKLPAAVAKARTSASLVLLPSLNHVAHIVPYVRDVVAPDMQLGGGVHILDLPVIAAPKPKPCVYYCAVGEFLAMMSVHRSVLTRLGITTIFIDESHVVRPEYMMFRYLVAIGFFKDVVLLYTSATAATDISMESKKSVITVSAKDVPASPNQATSAFPAHFSRIASRVILFVANDAEAQEWCAYYATHDVPAMAVGYGLRSQHLSLIESFLRTNSSAVLVTTGILDTSYTFNLDVSVDLGKTSVLDTDFNTGELSVKVVPATASEQIQRAGRVNRFKPGMAYIVKVANTMSVSESDPNICQYVYLWSRVFGLDISDPSISMFSSVFGNCSPRVIAMLLTSAIPPFVLLSYLQVDGVVRGFEKPLKLFTAVPSIVYASKLVVPPEKIKTWSERTVHHSSLPQGFAMYKSRFSHASEFALAFYHLWGKFANDDDAQSINSYGLSVMGEEGGKRVSFAKPSYRDRIPASMITIGTLEEESSESESSCVSSTYASTVKTAKPVEVRPMEPRSVPARPVVQQNFARPVSAVEPGPSRVEQWTTQLGMATKSTSSSSTGRPEVDLNLKKIKHPEKYPKEFMYPMDFELRKTFITSYAENYRDRERVKNCVSGKQKFGALHTDTDRLIEKQKLYFLSFLRVHRTLVVSLMQSRAAPEKRSLFGGRSNYEDILSQIHQVVRLLTVCTEIGYHVGIERSKLHSFFGRSSSTAVVDETLKHQRELAKTAVSRFSPAVMETTGVLALSALPVVDVDEGVTVANGWYINGLYLTCKHVWEEMSDRVRSGWTQLSSSHVLEVDDSIGVVADMLGGVVAVRQPRDGEYVGLYGFYGRSRPKLYGFHRIFADTDPVLIDATYYPGMSGSLIVAYSDGAVVGMYSGEYMQYGGINYGRVSILQFPP